MDIPTASATSSAEIKEVTMFLTSRNSGHLERCRSEHQSYYYQDRPKNYYTSSRISFLMYKYWLTRLCLG